MKKILLPILATLILLSGCASYKEYGYTMSNTTTDTNNKTDDYYSEAKNELRVVGDCTRYGNVVDSKTGSAYKPFTHRLQLRNMQSLVDTTGKLDYTIEDVRESIVYQNNISTKTEDKSQYDAWTGTTRTWTEYEDERYEYVSRISMANIYLCGIKYHIDEEKTKIVTTWEFTMPADGNKYKVNLNTYVRGLEYLYADGNTVVDIYNS